MKEEIFHQVVVSKDKEVSSSIFHHSLSLKIAQKFKRKNIGKSLVTYSKVKQSRK
jgi:hypothetical protein